MAAQLQFLHQRLQFDYQSKAHPSVIRTIYDLKIPSLVEQQAIAEVLDDAENEITTLETQITCLQAEKKALMQQLLTGKKRLAV
jgi:type I restriction enzyme S subunit